MGVIYILWLRQLKRYLRSRARIVSSLAQPLIYLLAMGYGLSPVFKQANMGNYIQFVTPGLIGMTILFTSIFSGIELLMDRQFGFLKETLVAPVPRGTIRHVGSPSIPRKPPGSLGTLSLFLSRLA